MSAPLAEIIEEGRRLHAEHDAATMVRSLRTADMLVRFYSEHGPRLLAVAAAAVETAPQIEGFCREVEMTPRPPGGQQAGLDRCWASRVPPSVIGELRWYGRAFRGYLAAFDAAARGAM